MMPWNTKGRGDTLFVRLELTVPALHVNFSAPGQLLRALDGLFLSWKNGARTLGVRFFHCPFIALLYDKNVVMVVSWHKTILPVYVLYSIR